MKVERSQRANTGEWVVTFLFDKIDLAEIIGSDLRGLYGEPDAEALATIIMKLAAARRKKREQSQVRDDPAEFLRRHGFGENTFDPESFYDQYFGNGGTYADAQRRAHEDQARAAAQDPFNFADSTHSSPPPWRPSEPAWAKILGVPATASQAEIKSAYRKLAMKHHPDKGGDPVTFNKINQAYKEASG